MFRLNNTNDKKQDHKNRQIQEFKSKVKFEGQFQMKEEIRNAAANPDSQIPDN